MALLRRTAIVGAGLASALMAGQAPEFAQQYRQRLGGAIEELHEVVARFDADAAQNGLDRDAALQRYGASSDKFLQDRGISMRATIERYESLWAQAITMQNLPPLARPLALLRERDERLATGAWRDYEPALPVTAHGLAWAAAGFGLGAIIAGLLAGLLRRGRRALRRSRT
jgi:hypothetical protein